MPSSTNAVANRLGKYLWFLWESFFYLISVLGYKWKASLLLIIPSFFLIRIIRSYWTAMYILGTINNMFDLVVDLISLGLLGKMDERKYATGWWWVVSKNIKHLGHGKFSKMLAITIFKWQLHALRQMSAKYGDLLLKKKNTLLLGEKKPTSCQIFLSIYNNLSYISKKSYMYCMWQ